MKLLIDIPEHIYEHAKAMTEDSRDEGEAMRAIANGSLTRCKGMDEAEKERLIKKGMLSIENRVRHVFNQGYEMGLKANKSEIPTSCGDAISRDAVLDLIEHYNSDGLGSVFYGYEEGVKFAGAINKLPSVSPQQKYKDAAEAFQLGMALGFGEKHDEMDKVIEEIKKVVTPQQRTGRWIINRDSIGRKYGECSECMMRQYVGTLNYCPNCGCVMKGELE